MILAALLAAAGYATILKSDIAIPSVFGYDWLTHTWVSKTWILHVFLGYVTLLLTFAQVVMGLATGLLLRIWEHLLKT